MHEVRGREAISPEALKILLQSGVMVLLQCGGQLYAGSGDVPGYIQVSVITSEGWLLGHARVR